MDFSRFDRRCYPVAGAREGYGEWAATYEETVLDLMDQRLLARLETVDWPAVGRALDLACGTGRAGAWLRSRGVGHIDGVDLTPEMLARARERAIYDELVEADLTSTGLDAGTYDLVLECLADEHLADIAPLYCEANRLLASGGRFVIVGYHPFFLMLTGMPTHFARADGTQLAIESHIHLMSDHVRAARASGLELVEMTEGLIDDEWISRKPKWEAFRSYPVSYAMVWRKRRR